MRPLAVLTALLVLPAAALAAADNLLPNGDLDLPDPADASKPLGWERPDGLGVMWADAPALGGSPRGKALRIDTRTSERDLVASWRRAGIDDWDIPEPAANPVAETYGISVYSDPIPVKRGQAYKVTWDWLGPPGGVKVWVRGYARIPDDLPAEVAASASGAAAKGPEGARAAKPTRMRRLYEALAGGDAHLAKDDGTWHTSSHCFHPTRNTPPVTELRVMLFAYYPPKVYWFDRIRIEPISAEEYKRYRDNQGK